MKEEKSHCSQGHEYTPENTYVYKAGGKGCRTCTLARVKDYDERISLYKQGKGPKPAARIVLPEATLWARVNKTEGCWLWTGRKANGGYGRLTIKGKDIRAHRFSFALHGPGLTADLMVCHSCDIPACVNPAHLFLGTATDNMRDMVSKGRCAQQAKTHCPKGHEFTPGNTYISASTGRACRICIEARRVAYKPRKRLNELKK